jgi:hypothetical protein
MNAARSLSTPNRTRQILEDLEAVRENLLALSDDIWDSIDRQDLAAFDDGRGEQGGRVNQFGAS